MPTAPERMARNMLLSSVLLTSKMTFVPGRNRKISRVASIPPMPSNSTAMTTKSGASRRQISMAPRLCRNQQKPESHVPG
jgi:hypothetical protein